MSAAPGSVSTQATAMLPATPQRTAESALGRAGAHDAARDHVRGRQREADVRGGQDDRRARALRGEALRRVHLDDPAAHRADDPPAADVGPERDRASPSETTTQVGTSKLVGGQVAVGDRAPA